MLDQNPDFKVDHQDLEEVGIAPEPMDWEEEDEYDIEGVDDVPMKLEDHDLRDFKYGITTKEEFGAEQDLNLKKLRYIFREIMVDLGLGKIDFWSVLTSTLIICFALWSRLFIHYGAMYLMLKWIDIPVTGVTWEWYRLDISYHYWNAN